MGTSVSYSAPTTVPWPALKTTITRLGGTSARDSESIRDAVTDYIKAGGGARQIASGRGSIGGAAGSRAAAGIGGFFSVAGSQGFAEALRRFDLQEFVGKPLQQILSAVVDKLGGSANTIDGVDARNALSRLMDELFAEAKTPGEIETILAETAQDINLEKTLLRFFGHYLYEQFCRVFYEHLVTRVGQDKADSFMREIRDYIQSSLANHTTDSGIRGIDWHGQEGIRLAQKILQDTLEVFGG